MYCIIPTCRSLDVPKFPLHGSLSFFCRAKEGTLENVPRATWKTSHVPRASWKRATRFGATFKTCHHKNVPRLKSVTKIYELIFFLRFFSKICTFRAFSINPSRTGGGNASKNVVRQDCLQKMWANLEGRQDCLHLTSMTLPAYQHFWRHFRRQFARG